MLVTDVGDEMCWGQFEDVDDGFGHFGDQNPLSLNISVGHQHPKDFTKILILSPSWLSKIVTNCKSPILSRQHQDHQSHCHWKIWLPKKTYLELMV